jgi:hypothetical protein
MKDSGITVRSVVIGLLLIPIASFWVSNSEMVTGVTEITSTSLLIGAVFILFILIGLNAFFERFLPRLSLNPREILLIYVAVAFAMSINGIGMFGFFGPGVMNPLWFGRPEIGFAGWSDFLQYIPNWFVPKDERVVRDFFLGDSSLLRHLRSWGIPIATWFGFIFILLFTTWCLNAIIRRQWMDYERLSFPVTALPLEMTLSPRFLRNRLFWAGFTIPVILQSVNTLHFFYPVLPYIWVIKAFNIGHLFTGKPWNAIGYLPVAFYPTVIGLTYFMPLDLSFSCWFFFLFRKVENVIASATGSVRFPAIGEQGAGAWIGLAFISLWMGRRYIFRVIRGRSPDDEEPLPYRGALMGFTLGFTALVFFCFNAGASLWASGLIILLFLIYYTAMTRIRAECGPIWHNGPIVPQDFLVRLFGTRTLGPSTLTVMAYLQWFNQDYRCNVMPHQLEAMRIAKSARMNLRRFSAFVLLATALCILSAIFNTLIMYYRRGAATPYVNPWRVNMGMIPFNMLANWLYYPRGSDFGAFKFFTAGFAVVAFLTFMRTRFFWWPFHPVGYALANTFGSLFLFWSAMMFTWFVKWLIINYRGLRAYRRWRPFFIGLVLGDFTIGSLWSIVGVVLDVPMYRVFPN